MRAAGDGEILSPGGSTLFCKHQQERESQASVSHKFLKHFDGSRARVSSVVAPHYRSYF